MSFSPAIRDFIAAPEDTRRLGSYCCKELLDTAGTAPVFKAVEEHAGVVLREVAIKVFDIGAKSDGWQERVMREARSLCRVQHPNVIRFHTLATDPKRGLMGLVMEFANGISLAKSLVELPRGDARRIARAVEIGVDVASALASAHEAGIVHCNVKPSNVVFTDGTHKLINFGIAASLASRDGAKDEAPPSSRSLKSIPPESVGARASILEKAGAESPIVGTVGYTDPVCIRTTASPTTASDLYSLGAMLYEVVAGDVPARGASGVDAKVLTGEAPAKPLAEVAPSVPAELGKLIDSLVSETREARPRSADAVRRELERIRSALTGHERALPAEERGPFPGLDRYDAADRDVFFGRSAEIAGALELARTRGLVALVGMSGSGKSSLTRAGIVPAIEEGALGGWPATYRSVVVTPGKDLMGAVDAALAKLLGAPLAKEPDAIVDQLRANVDANSKGIVLLVDQLEEIVRLHAKVDPARDRALALLSRLADANAGLRVIIAVRQDLLDEVLALDAHFSRALSRGIQHLGPLTPTAWEEVVDQSLEAYGYGFEDAALRKDVLGELQKRAAAMTLGQFGLNRLWAARDAKKKKIPRAAFADKGGMRGALAEHAAEAVAALDLPQEKLRDVLLSMTTPEGARTHIELDALTTRFGEPAKKAIFALTKARLVVSEKEGFTFVHDSVLREWGLVRGWIDDARDDRLLLARLERDAERWTTSRDSAELWRKSRLAAARDLWRRDAGALSDAARQFVTKSANEEGKAKVAFWTLAAMIVMIVVGGSLIYAKESREHADALAAALTQVKQLKQEAEENAMEAAASAKLLHDLQQQRADEHAAYGANVQAAMKKVANATTLDGAQKASKELAQPAAPSQAPVVPLPLNLLGSDGRSPALDPAGPSPGAGGAFDQGAIERVVAARKAGVKRTCLDRGNNTAASTKITASLTIAPNGSVQSASTSGDDPVIGKCIENQLRTWTFPAPGEVKQVQIPFVFVRQ